MYDKYQRMGKIEPIEWSQESNNLKRAHIVKLCPRPKNTLKEVAW